jgi:glycosyltransferase involved in cell wall biosynthesis
LHDIEVQFDTALRVVQLVTTIQIGGAERVTLDLAQECNRMGIRTVVAVLGEPTRRAYPKPYCFADLSDTPFDPESRAAAVERLCLEWGADIVHAHLVKASEAEAIRTRGVPLVVTVHNMPAAWPAGYVDAQKPIADLLIGCAQAVSRELEIRMPNAPVRTVWNGIDLRRTSSGGRDSRLSIIMRESLGWDASDFVLLAIANPRRQKRLERLPEIIVRLEERIGTRRVRLILAGEPATGSEDGRNATARLEAAIEEWHVQKALHWTGAIDDIAPLLATANAFVSTSELEGLSLAQLEALAAGLPVVATNVGGAAEIAARSDRMVLLPRDADAEAFANVLARLANAAPPRTPGAAKIISLANEWPRVRRCFTGGVLVENATHQVKQGAIWLLTNNFSTGGAQTSARRLLTGLFERGCDVRAATIEEVPERLSPGRRRLNAAGVPVHAITPNPNPEALVDALLDAMIVHPPHAVVFWNLISPGESAARRSTPRHSDLRRESRGNVLSGTRAILCRSPTGTPHGERTRVRGTSRGRDGKVRERSGPGTRGPQGAGARHPEWRTIDACTAGPVSQTPRHRNGRSPFSR